MVLDYGLRIVLKQCWPEYGCEMALKYGLKENLEWQFGISALRNGVGISALEYGLKNIALEIAISHP